MDERERTLKLAEEFLSKWKLLDSVENALASQHVQQLIDNAYKECDQKINKCISKAGSKRRKVLQGKKDFFMNEETFRRDFEANIKRKLYSDIETLSILVGDREELIKLLVDGVLKEFHEKGDKSLDKDAKEIIATMKSILIQEFQ